MATRTYKLDEAHFQAACPGAGVTNVSTIVGLLPADLKIVVTFDEVDLTDQVDYAAAAIGYKPI